MKVSDEELAKTYSISIFCAVIGFVTLIGLFIARVRLVVLNVVEPKRIKRESKGTLYFVDIENHSPTSNRHTSSV